MKTNQYPQFTKFQISLIITNPDLQESPKKKKQNKKDASRNENRNRRDGKGSRRRRRYRALIDVTAEKENKRGDGEHARG